MFSYRKHFWTLVCLHSYKMFVLDFKQTGGYGEYYQT